MAEEGAAPGGAAPTRIAATRSTASETRQQDRPRLGTLYLVRGRRTVSGKRQTATALRRSYAAAERVARSWEARGWTPVTIWSHPITEWAPEPRGQTWRLS